MDNKKKDYIQVMRKFCQIHSTKKPIQIIVSISVFALLFSQLPLFNGLQQYVDHCFSDAYSTMLIIGYKAERNFMFLLFNVILALIIKTSGLLRDSPKKATFEVRNFERMAHEAEVSVSELSETEAEVKKEDVLGEEQKGITANVEGGENMHSTTEDSDDGNLEENDNFEGDDIFEAEEEEEEEFEQVSSEEFFLKCEDFIQKMREGIKTEFQKGIIAQEVGVLWPGH